MIRLYGHKDGQGSFVQVTRGLRLACEARGLFAGLVPIDTAYNDTVDYPGALAAVGLNAGAPTAVLHSHRMGNHKKRWLLLAPNSDKVPAGLAAEAGRWIDGLLAPSSWAVDVLSRQFKVAVLRCPHGVHPEYQRDPASRAVCRVDYDAGRFRVLHLSSTSSERKGTRELLAAWKLLIERKVLHPGMTLFLVMPAQGIEQWRARASELEGVTVIASERGFAARDMAALYNSMHLVCQPSRAEGFGLTPIESRACGVPIVATDCTGHGEHVRAGDPGVRVVVTGPPGPSDDLPGAVAPTLEAEEVLRELAYAIEHWRELEAAAAAAAPAVQAEWSWERQSGPALETIAREAG